MSENDVRFDRRSVSATHTYLGLTDTTLPVMSRLPDEVIGDAYTSTFAWETLESLVEVGNRMAGQDGEVLRLTFTDEFGGEGSPLIPKDDSLETPEFYQLSAGGERQHVEFDVGEDGTDLFVDRWRLHETR